MMSKQTKPSIISISKKELTEMINRNSKGKTKKNLMCQTTFKTLSTLRPQFLWGKY